MSWYGFGDHRIYNFPRSSDLVAERVRVRMDDKQNNDNKGRKRMKRASRRWQTISLSGHTGLINYKNTTLLRRHITVQGRIFPRQFNQLTAKQQRHMSRAIKRARNMCLVAPVRRRR